MSNKQISFYLGKNGNLYNLWLAAVNHKEFQKIMKLEDFEIILVSTICDEIMDKMSQCANELALDTDRNEVSIRSPFLEASQLAIGLVCVHQQQVKFLYEQACRYSLQSRFVIEKQRELRLRVSNSKETEHLSSSLPLLTKLPLKRKRSTVGKQPKARRTNKHTFPETPETPVIFDLNEELSDREIENQTTMELLKNLCVIDASKITIREDNSESNDLVNENETDEDFMDFELSEIIANNESNSVSSLNEDVMDNQLSATVLNQLDHNNNTNDSEEMRELQNADSILNVLEGSIDEQESHSLMQSENHIENFKRNGRESVRKITMRKRKRVQPFKDRILIIDVERNMLTSVTTQRHLHSLDDCTQHKVRLNHLCSDLFNSSTRVNYHKFTFTPIQRLKFSTMSNKLSIAFKRGTLLKMEKTDSLIVPSELSNDALTDTQINSQNDIFSNQSQNLNVSPLEDRSTVWAEPSLEVFPTQTSPIEPTQMPMILDIGSTNQYQHVEVAPEIRQLLQSSETTDSLNRFNTNSQKEFTMRSRQNRHEWGTEGVLRKLLTLWKTGVHPIGMEELMQSNNQRLSAATAFFSIMALNSPRIDLINIEKNPNSNTIYNIVQSTKLIELQHQQTMFN